MKIVSYNIHMGLETETLVRNIKNFVEQGVDIFCLQEFWKWMQPADLEALILKELGSEWQMEYITPTKPHHDFGVCILWKNTVLKNISFERLSLPLLPKAKLWEKSWIRIHGFKTFIVQRGALVGTFTWNNHSIRITNVHLDWQGGIKQRLSQLSYIRNYLTSHKEADIEIICGDFNSLGIFNKAKQTEMIADAIGNEFQNACNSLNATCPPIQHLDHMFVKNLKVNDFKICKLPGSDHFPLFANLDV